MISFNPTLITIKTVQNEQAVDREREAIFSPLKRVVKEHCSRHPQRGSIPTRPEKVKCKCTKDSTVHLLVLYPQTLDDSTAWVVETNQAAEKRVLA